MPLRNFKQTKPVCCEKTTNIKEVARMMKSKNVGSILVTDEGRPVGIITDRDLVIRCAVDGFDWATTPVETVMSSGVFTVKTEDGIGNVIDKMRQNGVRRLPIVDRDGKAVGIISSGDILGLLSQELADISTAVQLPKHRKFWARAAA